MGTHIEADADLPLVRLCRRQDPQTSKSAAIRTRSFASGHRAAILQALEAGPAGQTELARRTGLTVAAVSRRLNELVRGGLIVRNGDDRSASGGREARYCIRSSRVAANVDRLA